MQLSSSPAIPFVGICPKGTLAKKSKITIIAIITTIIINKKDICPKPSNNKSRNIPVVHQHGLLD